MVFTTSIFLFAFLPICLIAYCIAPKKYRNFVLFMFSIMFYAWGGVQYAVLVLASAFINYILGIKISSAQTDKSKKLVMIIGVIFNIGVLSIFKYFNFFVTNIEEVLSLVLGTEVIFNEPIIPLPIGISFFTFQILSYVIDVYRGNVKAQKSFVNLGLYIMLFPQLIAGPIVRYIDVEREIENRTVSIDDIRYGATRFVYGFIKKIILSNIMGELSDLLRSNMEQSPTVFAWASIICFALQILFDFSAYSDMAIGLGRIFGFHFLENFNYPYISSSIQDFWRRWHISLSSWFRDYLYIPLGGNKKGARRTYINLLIVFFVTGLWHGASWNFIVWGLFHGFFLILERLSFFKKILAKLPRVLKHIYTMVIVLVGWVFFDIMVLSEAISYIGTMFAFDFAGWEKIFFYFTPKDVIVLLLAFVFCTPIAKKIGAKFNPESNTSIILQDLGKIIMFGIALAYMLASDFNPFIYFRF